MRTLALLGGMTYGATGIYYEIINKHVQRTLGGTNSAQLLLYSFNHADMGALFTAGKWDEAASAFARAATNLKAAGGDALMICCNIGHKVADDVERQTGMPVLHIADYTGKVIQQQGISRVGLIGTIPVMEDTFFRDRLKQKFVIDVVIPEAENRVSIQEMIFKELGANVFHDGQRTLLLDAIRECKDQGAQGIIFACTELQFVVKPEDVDVPLWDTMEAHALGAAKWALGDNDV